MLTFCVLKCSVVPSCFNYYSASCVWYNCLLCYIIFLSFLPLLVNQSTFLNSVFSLSLFLLSLLFKLHSQSYTTLVPFLLQSHDRCLQLYQTLPYLLSYHRCASASSWKVRIICSRTLLCAPLVRGSSAQLAVKIAVKLALKIFVKLAVKKAVKLTVKIAVELAGELAGDSAGLL